MDNYTMHVISHTHWDREWYLAFQQFRIRLVDLMDNLIKILDTDPEFKYFNLDGQTIVLEDYLEIHPENEEKLRKYIRDGRMLVGPWYQLNDEFLVSGESTVRSLLIGHQIAKDFGGVMKVGYLPDQFGNISQMPQIFREFGIDNCIFGRGYQLTDDRKMEIFWESPDGSSVLASLMAFWYNNAQRFPYETDAAVEYTERIRNTMAPVSNVHSLLLMNGVDHLEAQEGLPDILRRVNQNLKGDSLVHSTLPDYINALKGEIYKDNIALQIMKGELREDRWESVLAGTLSSRMYLKQANKDCEVWLGDIAEPLASFAWMLGKEYPSGMLRYTWKLLMQNHPHDSICGCSIDQVHEEMMPRFAQVKQISEEIADRSMRFIADAVQTSDDSVVVFNSLSSPRTDRLTAEIDFPVSDLVRGNPVMEPGRDVESIELLDPDGSPVPFKLIDSRICGKQVLNPIELPMAMLVRRFTIEFAASDVPAFGYKTYTIKKTKAAASESPIKIDGNTISNGLISISPGSGGITLTTLDGSIAPLEGIGVFEDVGDVGDEYRYIKPADDCRITTAGTSPEVEIIDNSPVSATIKLRIVMNIPVSSADEERRRSDETVACPVTSWFTITAGSPRVDVVTEFENKAKDHRFRVLFPSNIMTDAAHAEGQFDVITRSIRPPADWPKASTFFPQRSWVDVNDGKQGLTIINKGLPEYEVYDDEARTIGLTLLRSVGRLSGGGDTAEAIPTPGAQCIGTYRFEYAVLPHMETWEKAEVWKQAHQHNVPLVYTQTGAHAGELPTEGSFIEFNAEKLVVTAIKKAEDRDSLLVRFFNIRETDAHDICIRVPDAESARTVNLNEEPGRDLIMLEDGTVNVDVQPKKIGTIEFLMH